MAVQTPIAGSRFDNVDGNKREVTAKVRFGGGHRYLQTGLAVITDVEVTSGAGKIVSATVSGGTVTFGVGSDRH